MFLLLLALTAVAVLVALGAVRVLRVRMGREPQPEGARMLAVFLLILLGPPIAYSVVLPASFRGQVDGLSAVMVYGFLIVVLWFGMWLAARLVSRYAPLASRSVLVLALTGNGMLADVPFDPPMTEPLVESVALVDRRNSAFPRGEQFMHQVEQPGFHDDWDALDTATRGLEGLIADAGRLRTGVARRATETASDARSRLDTLRRDAAAHGQSWAA